MFTFLSITFINSFFLALNIVFGSLYNDEVTINPIDVISVLATATMFQLDGMIEKCREVMLETINTQVQALF